MIEVNLLPHREARRVADLRESLAVLALGVILICAGIYFANSDVGDQLVQSQNMVRQLEADIARYRPQEAQVKEFRARREELEDKLAVIDGLEQARSGPVRILDELSRRTPDRLWLTLVDTASGRIRVEGESIDTGVVADFLRALNSSNYFVNVDLDRTAGGSEHEGVRLVKFAISASLANPTTEDAEQG